MARARAPSQARFYQPPTVSNVWVSGCYITINSCGSNGPALFGREWLSTMKLDMNQIDSVQNDALDSFLQKYKSIFTEELGKLKIFQAHLCRLTRYYTHKRLII